MRQAPCRLHLGCSQEHGLLHNASILFRLDLFTILLQPFPENLHLGRGGSTGIGKVMKSAFKKKKVIWKLDLPILWQSRPPSFRCSRPA